MTFFYKVAQTEPMCVSGIGFQFHTPGTKKNILGEKKGKKITFSTKNREFLEFFMLMSDASVRGGKWPNKTRYRPIKTLHLSGGL